MVDGRHFAVCVRDGDKAQVVVDGVYGPRYDSIYSTTVRSLEDGAVENFSKKGAGLYKVRQK